MLPLRFMCDNALCLLVFLCKIVLSLQGCANYLDDFFHFLPNNCLQHQYIRLDGDSLKLNRTELVNHAMKRWCIQSGNNKSHECNILKSCFNTSVSNNLTSKKTGEPYPPEKIVSLVQLYCMVNIVKNETHFPAECIKGDSEKIYVCTLTPTEKNKTTTTEAAKTEAATKETATEAATTEAATTEAATTEAATTEAATTFNPSLTHNILAPDSLTGVTKGFIASNVILAFLLVLLIVSNAAWCLNFQRRRKHQLWIAGHPCACTDQRNQHLMQNLQDPDSTH